MSYHEDSIWSIRNLRLFQELSHEELRELSPFLNVRQYRRGEVIFRMEDQAGRLYVLEAGTIKTSILSPGGEERILDIFRPGDTFGELFFGKDSRRVATTQALSDVTVRTMTGEAFMGLMRTRPALCLTFVRDLVEQQRRTLTRVEPLMHIRAGDGRGRRPGGRIGVSTS